ncbi:MAG: response regulator [Lachnospiraceae bacterium]|nr:response regulator [Lachnospiraceae bacterium]
MYVLNVEDDAWKHRDICKVLESCGVKQIDRAGNLEEGLGMLGRSVSQEKPYDLIVTDMYYPLSPGGSEARAGMLLIEKVKEMNCAIPIVVCSSVELKIPGILGAVHYSQRTDWENDLRKLVRGI